MVGHGRGFGVRPSCTRRSLFCIGSKAFPRATNGRSCKTMNSPYVFAKYFLVFEAASSPFSPVFCSILVFVFVVLKCAPLAWIAFRPLNVSCSSCSCPLPQQLSYSSAFAWISVWSVSRSVFEPEPCRLRSRIPFFLIHPPPLPPPPPASGLVSLSTPAARCMMAPSDSLVARCCSQGVPRRDVRCAGCPVDRGAHHPDDAEHVPLRRCEREERDSGCAASEGDHQRRQERSNAVADDLPEGTECVRLVGGGGAGDGEEGEDWAETIADGSCVFLAGCMGRDGRGLGAEGGGGRREWGGVDRMPSPVGPFSPCACDDAMACFGSSLLGLARLLCFLCGRS